MISMELYDYIRYSYSNLGQSIKEINRSTKKSRQTIRKAIAGVEPQYRLEKKRPKPMMDAHLETIRHWLLADKKVPKKQRHTAKLIYKRLEEEFAFKGSSSTVRRTVNELKRELDLMTTESFIPSDPEKRYGAEFDWGEAYVDIDGVRTKVYMFCMRSKYSGKIFVRLYPAMLQECFFDGHIAAFSYFGGVFREIVYDNLKTAVQKVLTGRDRIEQNSFVSFRSYYCFNAEFCNTAKGSEKGGVEGLVGYARRNYLTPIQACKSLDQINNRLLEQCITRDLSKTSGQDLTIGELFGKEKLDLLAVPQLPYDNYKLIETTVDKYLTVNIKQNHYSVPEKYAKRDVTVELGLFDVRITYQNKVIAKHKRDFTKNQWILDPWHYMELLRRKSRALKGSRILTTIEENWDPIVKKLWEFQVLKYGQFQGSKEFLDSILFFKDKKYSEMIAVFELALENETICQGSIKVLYETLMEDSCTIEEASCDHLGSIADFTLPTPDVDKFDQLMEGVCHG